MFKRNMRALKNNNLYLWKKMNEIDIESVKKAVEAHLQPGNAIVITYNNVPLDDINNPYERTKQLWHQMIKSQLVKNDIVFIFGLGLGYIIKRAYIETPSRIVLYEPHVEVLRFAIEYTDLERELSDPRVLVTDTFEQCSEFVRKKYLSNDKIEVFFNDQYGTFANDELGKFTSNILAACKNKLADIETGYRYRDAWVENIIKNTFSKSNYYSINFLKNKFEGKTALIIGAGPSLKKDIEKIKVNRNKFVIIAVNKIYEYLVENGIQPDFTVFIDAEATSFNFKNVIPEHLDTNIIMTLKTDSFCSRIDAKNTFLIFNNDETIFSYLHSKMPDMIKLTDFSGTTTGVAYFVAKILGFEKIIFAGLDLAFKSNDEFYANNEKLDIKNGDVIINQANIKKAVYLEGINGEKLLSREDYAIYANELSEIFSCDKTSKIYNLTDFGVKIKGMIYDDLDNILDDKDKSSIDKILEELSNKRLSKKQVIFNETLNKEVLDLIQQCRDLKETFLTAKKPSSEIIKKITLAPLLYILVEKDILNLLNRTKEVINMFEFTLEFKSLCDKAVESIEKIEKFSKQ